MPPGAADTEHPRGDRRLDSVSLSRVTSGQSFRCRGGRLLLFASRRMAALFLPRPCIEYDHEIIVLEFRASNFFSGGSRPLAGFRSFVGRRVSK
jgi:hypothetical protein